MSTNTSNRTCGSCGAPVTETDVTCPRCGALLAAYEAPRGSASVSEATSQAPERAVDPVLPQHPNASQPTVPSASAAYATPLRAVTTSPPQAASSAASSTAPPEPEPAVTAARTDLVSALNVRQGKVEASATAARTDLVSVLESRKAAIQASATNPSRPRPGVSRETRKSQHPTPTAPLSARQTASRASSFGKLALGVLMILVFLGILDFNLIPILVLGVVTLSLLGVMRSAAKASGRKTTSMYDPSRRDPRR